MQETQVQSLGQEHSLEEQMAIHFSILAWKIPQAEAPGEACIFIYLVPNGDLEKEGGEEPQQS